MNKVPAIPPKPVHARAFQDPRKRTFNQIKPMPPNPAASVQSKLEIVQASLRPYAAKPAQNRRPHIPPYPNNVKEQKRQRNHFS
jgi:hypothetical protein